KTNERQAKEEEQKANTAWEKAVRAQKTAEAAEKRKDQELTRSEWLLYASQIGRAQREWEVGNVRLAWHYLDSCRPDFRDWEYRYLHALFNRNQTTLRGHTNAVQSVAFSPEGKRIVSASYDNDWKLWDVQTGRDLLTTQAGTNGAACVAFSP